jgi:hypothetical protein
LVDATDLIIVVSAVQTVVITLTLVVFIMQFRSQEKALKESTYQNIMGRYTDYIRMLVERPELNKMVNEIGLPSDGAGTDPEKLSSEDGATLAYLLLGYGIIEETYSLYSKKWIDEETWAQWAAFLKVLSRHPLFGRISGGSRGTFDKGFEDYVARMLKEKEPAPGSSPPS